MEYPDEQRVKLLLGLAGYGFRVVWSATMGGRDRGMYQKNAHGIESLKPRGWSVGIVEAQPWRLHLL